MTNLEALQEIEKSAQQLEKEIDNLKSQIVSPLYYKSWNDWPITTKLRCLKGLVEQTLQTHKNLQKEFVPCHKEK